MDSGQSCAWYGHECTSVYKYLYSQPLEIIFLKKIKYETSYYFYDIAQCSKLGHITSCSVLWLGVYKRINLKWDKQSYKCYVKFTVQNIVTTAGILFLGTILTI